MAKAETKEPAAIAPKAEDPNAFPGDRKPGQDVEIYDPGQDAGSGMEDISKDEYTIPFLRILDPKSPQCKPKEAGGPGAKPGSILNTATGEFYDRIEFIPVHRDHHYVEWLKKNDDGSGGGFVGIRPIDDEVVLRLRAEHGQFGKLPNGENELAETFYLFGLAIADGVTFPAVIAFASTQIKKYKAFITRVMSITYVGRDGANIKPPLWAHKWVFTTVYESKGTLSWYGWKIALLEEPPIKSRLKLTDPLYIQGREFYDLIKSGKATVQHETAKTREPGDDADEIAM